MGVMLFEINPLLAFVQRFVPRFVMGILVAYIYKFAKKAIGNVVAHYISGFFAAFLNTALFMGFLVLLFGNTEYIKELMNGKNVIVFICTFVGINAVFEMLVSTVLTGVIAKALEKARLIKRGDN